MDMGAKNGVVGGFLAAAALPHASMGDMRLGRAGARTLGYAAAHARAGPRGGGRWWAVGGARGAGPRWAAGSGCGAGVGFAGRPRGGRRAGLTGGEAPPGPRRPAEARPRRGPARGGARWLGH
jgi:hypothetical protein